MRFSVVIPVYNEADNVQPLVAEISTVLGAESDYEIVVVDDGSTDDTLARLDAARKDYPRLRVLLHPRRCGQSAALLTAVEGARSPLIVTLDGDGQNDPADILALLKRYHAEHGGPLLLAGNRTHRQDTLVKRLSSRAANAVRRFVLADATPDSACGIKLFPRELFLVLPAFNHMHRFLPALAQRAGARTLSIPVNNRARRHGVSKYGINNRLWAGLLDLFGVWWLLRRRMRPEVSELK